MLTIRMRRVGAKKKPLFRMVVTESSTAHDGAALEVLGHYNPTAEPETVEVDRQRLRYWVDRGAQLSDTVRTLVARHPEVVAGAAAEEAPVAEPTPAPVAEAEPEVEAAEASAEAPAAASEPTEDAAAPAEAAKETEAS